MMSTVPDNNAILVEHAAAIRQLGKQTVENVIEIGRHLTEAKAEIKKLGRSWGDWLEVEFKWSNQQARRCMHIFERKSELNNLLNADLPVSALYLLAAPSTPKEARNEIIERAQAGESVSVAKTKRVVKRHKSPSSKRKQRDGASIRIPSCAEVARREKLGPTIVNKLRGTSLGRAAEMDELLELDRAGQTEVVKALIAAAIAGEKVSALRVELPPASTAEQLDISATDTSEVGRQGAHIQKLENELAKSKAEIAELKRDVEDAKAAAKSPSECKSGFRCSICHEKKHALLRPVFICDGCINIHEVREAMPPPDDGLGIPENLDRSKQTGATP
jgi:hypothetical protein